VGIFVFPHMKFSPSIAAFITIIFIATEIFHGFINGKRKTISSMGNIARSKQKPESVSATRNSDRAINLTKVDQKIKKVLRENQFRQLLITV
jgi:hypothetical protein